MKIKMTIISIAMVLISGSVNAIEINEKALYIAKAQKTSEMAMLGLRASMIDSKGCTGERKLLCNNFIDSINTDKLNKIVANMFLTRFTEEDINNIYLYFKDGPGKKEIEIVLIQVKKMINPNEQVKAGIPLTADEDSYRTTFNKSSTGKRFGLFAKVASHEYQKAAQPYMSALAKNAGLTK